MKSSIEYEQSLVETAVFLAVRDREPLECEFHLRIDPIYEIPDEEARQREFKLVFCDFYARLKLDRVIADLIAQCPLIAEHVDRCIVREAPRERAESAELFVRRDGNGDATRRTLVILVAPQSLVDSRRFVPRMRRELLHVADMLDPYFGYQCESFSDALSRPGPLRDRYRVLWDLYVEGRLVRQGFAGTRIPAPLRRAFDRLFAGVPEHLRRRAMDRLLQAPQLTHHTLLNWAQHAESLFDSSTGAAAR